MAPLPSEPDWRVSRIRFHFHDPRLFRMKRQAIFLDPHPHLFQRGNRFRFTSAQDHKIVGVAP